ncbi:hypothetical protein LEP1GSC068_2729 [Leptospira sp. Fiocruz LV3954]|nr:MULTISPECIES: hypothetical protein [unclassified Leptospira]EKO78680.1 hypothetical protein LEP1GSC068_2729 [Leptospira sp. Fiocruz LV3954]EMI68599.1 hypothetical protein LEP1GSC076_0450 [Leptospira sp. Fiocruz LV4135]
MPNGDFIQKFDFKIVVFGFYRGSHKGSTTKLFAENSNDKMAPSVVQTADLLLVIRTTTVPFVLKE